MEGEGGPVAVSAGPLARSGWVVSPAFDLLFLANLGWPLALLPGFVTPAGTTVVEFWQVYFLTTPHRWLTLFLVATDPDRRDGRPGRFLIVALAALAAVAGARLVFGGFLCLLAVDTLWNAWHFAAQHHGVLRLYARPLGDSHPQLERGLLRLFITYAILRSVTWLVGWVGTVPAMDGIDVAMLAVPLVLLGREIMQPARGRGPKRIYLVSVCALYGLLLGALHWPQRALALALLAAASTFHAVEYLAVVTHYAWRRRQAGSDGLFRAMARRWLTVLTTFALLFGLFESCLGRELGALWQGANLWAAFVHYAYDGIIWKLRRPATAHLLGAEGP